MSSSTRKRSVTLGLPPGSLVHVGERKTERAEISVIDYDDAGCRQADCAAITDCRQYLRAESVSWVNVNGVHDVQVMEQAGAMFGIHPLVLADILNTTQRPKFEDYDDYLFVVLKMLRLSGHDGGIDAEQVSFVVGRNFVLSFQESPGDVFDPLRDRLRGGKGRVRKMGSDYLVNCMVDAILDGYFVILEDLTDRVEQVEDELIAEPDPALLNRIYLARRQCAFLRKCTRPLREMVSALQRSDSELVHHDTRVYLRDLYDHTIQIIDTVEGLHDSIAGMIEMYLSSASNRMNEVMKVLTMIATIFIPLTFMVGVYGMNLKIPETNWAWFYPALWGLMIAIAAGMFYWFRRQRWI